MKFINDTILHWRSRRMWTKTLRSLLSDRIDSAVIEEVQRRNPRYLRDDGFRWLNESIAHVNRAFDGEIISIVSQRLQVHYRGILAYHGCRPTSLASYLENGLRPTDITSLQRQAINEFGDSPMLRSAIANLRGHYEAGSDGVVYLCLGKEPFLSRDYQGYLLRGSEYLSCIANSIGKANEQKVNGIPTIIECSIPSDYLDPAFWTEMAKQMIEDWFGRILQPNLPTRYSTYCVKIRKNIPPQQFVRIYQYQEAPKAHGAIGTEWQSAPKVTRLMPLRTLRLNQNQFVDSR